MAVWYQVAVYAVTACVIAMSIAGLAIRGRIFRRIGEVAHGSDTTEALSAATLASNLHGKHIREWVLFTGGALDTKAGPKEHIALAQLQVVYTDPTSEAIKVAPLVTQAAPAVRLRRAAEALSDCTGIPTRYRQIKKSNWVSEEALLDLYGLDVKRALSLGWWKQLN